METDDQEGRGKKGLYLMPCPQVSAEDTQKAGTKTGSLSGAKISHGSQGAGANAQGDGVIREFLNLRY
jgi:hypothetical protein